MKTSGIAVRVGIPVLAAAAVGGVIIAGIAWDQPRDERTAAQEKTVQTPPEVSVEAGAMPDPKNPVRRLFRGPDLPLVRPAK
jgi:hypothetical protein